MPYGDEALKSAATVKGGKAGRSFSVTIDPGGPDEREVDALADAEPVRAGEVIRIRTTGGGGWGDPLDRPVAQVLRDVQWGKVSVAGALRDYGVVVTQNGSAGASVDEPATALARAAAGAAARDQPFFDRGPGYATLSGGASSAAVDWL